jgi:Na+-transporting NADH:ubiquinone oxidoreductase subunit NqrD
VVLKVQTVIIQYLVVLRLLSVAERVVPVLALLAALAGGQDFLVMQVALEQVGKGMLAGLEVVEQPLRAAEVLVPPV